MANEIQVNYITGETDMYFTIHRESDGNVWDKSGYTWGTSIGANQKTTFSEVGATGLYIGTVDVNFIDANGGGAGRYTIKAWLSDDSNIGADYLYWNGITEGQLTQTEYDMRYGSSIDEPDGVASNAWDRMTQLWMRFFNKVDKDATTIKVYNKDDVAKTTQTYEEGDTDIVEKATSI